MQSCALITYYDILSLYGAKSYIFSEKTHNMSNQICNTTKLVDKACSGFHGQPFLFYRSQSIRGCQWSLNSCRKFPKRSFTVPHEMCRSHPLIDRFKICHWPSTTPPRRERTLPPQHELLRTEGDPFRWPPSSSRDERLP